MTDIHVTLTQAQIAAIAGQVTADILANTETILTQLGVLMSDQSNIDAQTAQIDTDVTAMASTLADIGTQVGDLDAAFTAYAAAHPEADLSGLTAKVAALTALVPTAEQIDTAAQGDVASAPGSTPPPVTPPAGT